MNQPIDNKNTCCFTGHRDISYIEKIVLKKKLKRVIDTLINQGIVYYKAGGALGFDTMAAQAVLKAREKNPAVKLILVLPYLNQAERWNERDQEIYEEIKKQADEVIFTSQEYTKGCMFKRNRYLVDNSSCCICYLKKDTGGTAYTVNYAKSKDLKIINLAE